MAGKKKVPMTAAPDPRIMKLLVPEIERTDYEVRRDARYTQRPNEDLVHNRSVSHGSTPVREATVKDGASFVEPMAGQCFNDQFPWGR